MSERHRFTATLDVEGHAICGVLTDSEGRERTFNGWLQLISILEPGTTSPPETAERADDRPADPNDETSL